MHQPISESQFETLYDHYMDVLSSYLDDLSEGGESTGTPPWFSCVVPDAIYELVSVAGVRDKLSVRKLDELWRLAGKHYSRFELYRIFRERIGGSSAIELYSPVMRKIARKSPELEAGASVFEPLSALGAALYAASQEQREEGPQVDALPQLAWRDFNQVLLKRLVLDGHLTGEDRDQLIARELGL
ncbi:hypothetical protein IAE33_003812 [Pseudomonas sp. S60]|uniref:hypothetical protein n=1 Tax=Pseudomonas sp. S60 TaxID=211124 RepID=UPI0019148D43|nr:hypothetical protein [Pseudomonas sp. S60]MBK5011952.1 hypothetical protein [Pseudomonas sp. S60]